MESGTDCAPVSGSLVPVPCCSPEFQRCIVAPLQDGFLHQESRLRFTYTSAVFLKNPCLEEKVSPELCHKSDRRQVRTPTFRLLSPSPDDPCLVPQYEACRARKKQLGYSEEDLKETYGFLLFDDAKQANALGDTGVLNGNNTSTALGDPVKGVSLCRFSDCLDVNRWDSAKSGYIAIIRLTKGRVKAVSENYTLTFTEPTAGFDCHVSDQLSSVSPSSSSFLSFQRSQYYIYELLDDGSNETARSPSLACPFAVVSFSYTDNKTTLLAPQIKSLEKKQVNNYFTWKGQLQVDTLIYEVGLRATQGTALPTQLPPVVKVDHVISMSNLRHLLPKNTFESPSSREVSVDGLYYSLCELVPSGTGQASPLSLLLQEILDKDFALVIPLNDCGFLILLHSSHFLTNDAKHFSPTDGLRGLFVFPEARVIQRDINSGQRWPRLGGDGLIVPSEILGILPALSYAESQVENTHVEPYNQLCDLLVHYMQSYATLMNPVKGGIFPDSFQYDDTHNSHKHLYSPLDRTKGAWHNLRTYLRKPFSFQLPVPQASEILALKEEKQKQELGDDVYVCISSPEEVSSSLLSMRSEDHQVGQQSPADKEAFMGSWSTSGEAQVNFTAASQSSVPSDLQAGDTKSDSKESNPHLVDKTNDSAVKTSFSSISSNLSEEVILSITSEQRVNQTNLGVTSNVLLKNNDLQLPASLTPSSQIVAMSCSTREPSRTRSVLDFPSVNNPLKRRWRTKHEQYSPAKKEAQTSELTVGPRSVEISEGDYFKLQESDKAIHLSGQPQLDISSDIDWGKRQICEQEFGKLPKEIGKPKTSISVAEERTPEAGKKKWDRTILMELEACRQRKKNECWDLKPVISECGKILVPHGSVDVTQIKSFKEKLHCTNGKVCPEKMVIDLPVTAQDTSEMEQDSSFTPETEGDKTEAILKEEETQPPKIDGGIVNPEDNTASDAGNGPVVSSCEHPSQNLSTDTQTLDVVSENPTQGHFVTNGEFLLSKLKSILLNGRREKGLTLPEPAIPESTQGSEPLLKKKNNNSASKVLKRNDATALVRDADSGGKDDSDALSIDPAFARALGLTRKEAADNAQKNHGQDTRDSSEAQYLTVSYKQPRVMQKPTSVSPKKSRIKTLKKHEDIPVEHVKKKWWLHFQTPASLSEKHLHKEYSPAYSAEEKMQSACSSTNALALLADLALGAKHDPMPPQFGRENEQKPQFHTKKRTLSKDTSSPEQDGALHSPLGHPVARPSQPIESQSPSHLVGGKDLIDLVSKEHAYSLPPTSSQPLGLPSMPPLVSPLTGSAGLLKCYQLVARNGFQTCRPFLDQEDQDEYKHLSPECLSQHVVGKRFRRSRRFENSGGSIRVTRQWKDNYDFRLDSKFSMDPKERAIIRALHGPWDFSIQDTTQEVQFIVHMWIGLFYSRSTARFFQLDLNSTYPCTDDDDESLEMPGGTVMAPALPELRSNLFAPSPDITDILTSKGLDLRKKDILQDEGTDILDLSMRTSEEIDTLDPQVSRNKTSVCSELKEVNHTSNSFESPVGFGECVMQPIHPAMTISEVDDVASIIENKMASTPVQRVCSPGQTDAPSSKDDRPKFILQGEMENTCLHSKSHQTDSRVTRGLHGSNDEKMNKKDVSDDVEVTQKSLQQKHGTDSSKSKTDMGDWKTEAFDVCEAMQDETQFGHGENWDLKPTNEEKNNEAFQKMSHGIRKPTIEDATKFCEGSPMENQTLVALEKPEAVIPGQAENFKEEEDFLQNEYGIKEQHGFDEKDVRITDVEEGMDLIVCESAEPIAKDYFEASNHSAPLEEASLHTDRVKALCSDWESRMPCTNRIGPTDDHITEKPLHSPVGLLSIHKECLDEAISPDAICVTDSVYCKKATLHMPNKSTHSPQETGADGSTCQGKDTIQKGSQSVRTIDTHSSDDKESDERDDKADGATHKESSYPEKHLPEDEVFKKAPSEETVLDELYLSAERAGKGLEKLKNGVTFPFDGKDFLHNDSSKPHVTHPPVNIEEVMNYQRETNPVAFLHTEVCGTFEMYGKGLELPASKISPLRVNDTGQAVILSNDSNEMLSALTEVRKPHESIHCHGSSHSCTSALIGRKFCNFTQNYPRECSAPIMNEMPNGPKIWEAFAVTTVQKLRCGLHPDIKLRSLRVRTTDKFLPKSSLTNKSIQTEPVDDSPFPMSSHSNKCVPASLRPYPASANFINKKMSRAKPAVASASISYEVHSNITDVSVQQCNSETMDEPQKMCLGLDPFDSFPPDKFPKMSQQSSMHNKPKATTSVHSSHEYFLYNQHPVMAVKPSESAESQAYILWEGHASNSAMSTSKNKLRTTLFAQGTSSTFSLLERGGQSFKENSTGLRPGMQMAGELSSKTWHSDKNCNKSILDGDTFDSQAPSCQDKGGEVPLSSFSGFCSESANHSSKPFDRNQHLVTAQGVEQTSEELMELEESGSSVEDNDRNSTDDSHVPEPHCSLIYTVFNTGQKISLPLLEDLSQRCLQNGIAQASMEQECLILSGKMNTQNESKLPFKSPVPMKFSSLEEVVESEEHSDATMFVGRTIKVDQPERNTPEGGAGNENMSELEKLSHETSNSVDNAKISWVISECSYNAITSDVCDGKRSPSRQKHLQMDTDGPRNNSRNQSDFCGHVKTELDKKIQNNLDASGKKSCKISNRFYILKTSDDSFFEDTKILLEEEGYTAVQPSQFFLDKNGSSLLVILRNEDIEEHICEVPHLLELKKTPGVQFAGIDEPDDVVNLTYQDLFSRGGFIMLDKAVLESISLRNMRKLSDVIQGLSEKGKWKWMFHYRDSHHLKKRARFNAEAEEKEQFLKKCQEAELLQVLPYHKCDDRSRDRFDYLSCLICLQMQNISARYPVFITDSAANCEFGRNGILTMTVDSFLTSALNDAFTA